MDGTISIKTPEEIAIMREGGRRLAGVMQRLKAAAVPGASTQYLNECAQELIAQSGARVAFKGYGGFPAAICTSVNDEVVHCVPSQARILQEGDIVGIDIGLIYEVFYLDMAETVGIGATAFEAQHLINATRKALRLGIKKVRPGATVGDIGNTIERFITSQQLSVVRDFVGHGIGRRLHEEPRIPNFGNRHEGERLEAGMVIAIEPMVTRGSWKLRSVPDGHGVRTADGSLAAHFEHTIAIIPDGHEILTKVQ